MAAKKDLVKARKKFVGSKRGTGKSDAQLRKQYFIKTRMEEMRAAGKEVGAGTRKRLAERYKTGRVKREGFYAGGSEEKARRQAAAKPKPKSATGSKPKVERKPIPSKYASPESAMNAKKAMGAKYGSPEIAAAKSKSMQSRNPSERNRRTAYGSPESALSAAKARKEKQRGRGR